jgi:cis-L-3-hydroxyproline dehydratase
MKIRRVTLYDVAVPFGDTAYTMGKQKSVSSITGSVVSLEADEGVIGWGEMVPWGAITYLPEFAEGVRAGLALLGPKLIGEDPTNLAAINQKMDTELYGHGYAKSAIDMACWDIYGKCTGQPLYNLLGGNSSIQRLLTARSITETRTT